MAFISKSANGPCYSCGKQCINVEFCSAGGSYDNDDIGSQGISLSRSIRVSITANPEFWGFSGVLISGYASYSNGYYDFFDGFDENHRVTKDCTVDDETITYGPFSNVARPDVTYRSVYDPDTGISKHYDGSSLEGSGIGRGGAEAYLINRPALYSADLPACSYQNPVRTFRHFPDNFGWGNKISFNNKIFKNISGAWRLSSIENCYSNDKLWTPSGYLIDCSGSPKQNITDEYRRYEIYEKTRVKGSGISNYYNYKSKCLPDGSIAGEYAGRFAQGLPSIYRSTGVSPFIQCNLSYNNNNLASGLRNGMAVSLENNISGLFNGIYTIFDVTHYGNYTNLKLVGTSTGNVPIESFDPQLNIYRTFPTGDFSLTVATDSGSWAVPGTHDPDTCCGLNAYGIANLTKQVFGSNGPNYHVDFRRVFNNPKNVLQSNRDREWRYDYDLFATPINAITGVNISEVALDYSYPSISGVEISGVSSGYPIISGDSYITVATGDAYISGYPVFERKKSYYGNFFETDRYDNVKRFDQLINRGKGRNATCYSKHATLEIFPDCLAQYDSYSECETETTKYVANYVPRLAFVYRGCDFNDNCDYDSSGLPLGKWKSQGSVPTGIDDLKRQLGGQEIHMFINLGTAWGGRKPGSPCQCNCEGDPPGQSPPEHVSISSPVTFPSFPNFDLDPSSYGCQDPRYQNYIKQLTGEVSPESSGCGKLPSDSAYACLVKQPYVTYGYIMNLCGGENENSKDVITNAFAKLHQEKTYTNKNPTGTILEPMYWDVVAPSALPVGGSSWSSGTTGRADGLGAFNQIPGSGYGFWGLADTNKQVVAPYFRTKEGQFVCCSSTGLYLDYSQSGTYINGWPTSAVPFLIEFEVDQDCVGCATNSMKAESLNLEIEGLTAEYIWNQTNKFGHNYCKYGATDGADGKAQLSRPDFTCASGFDLHLCWTGDSLRAKYSNYYDGNTCDCVNGFSTTLQPVKVNGTDIIIGWTSNPDGDGAGLIEISGCKDLNSAALTSDYIITEAGGYRILAQFDLACNGMHQFLQPAYYRDEWSYIGSPIATLWTSTSCSHHYPARVGSDGDLDLKTTLYLVSDIYLDVVRKFSQHGLKYKNLYSCLTESDFDLNGAFGLCIGDSVYAYGCDLGGFFYGCDDGGGGYPGSYIACSGDTLCNTCPTGVGSGQVTCLCDRQLGYEGDIPRRPPANYYLNECYCECSEPALVAEYVVTSSGLSLVSGDSVACANIYWMGTDTIPPTLISCMPPNPYLGMNLGQESSTDYYDWSHGVNGLVSGVRHELFQPQLPNPNSYCPQLSLDGIITPVECDNPDCTANNNAFAKTCGFPIYSSGTIPSEDVTVRKKKCHPEVAIVTRIDCLGAGSGYKLYISREYHEHDRRWLEMITVDGNDVCVSVNAGGYQYSNGTGTGCQVLPYALLADSVAPVYNPPCSIHPSSGVYVNQDFKYELSSSPSGTYIWNYFNLFYSNGFLPSISGGTLIPSLHRTEGGTFECTGLPLTIQDSGTIFETGEYSNFFGIFATSGKHSCVQDSTECGGELWCNKLFFPRHRYNIGTKIAPFGAPSVCTSNGEFKIGYNLDGYYETWYGTIDGGKALLSEQALRFSDWCNDDIIQESKTYIDIDDSAIYVDDYLPLIGVVHPGWRFTSDVKSCTVGGSGCQDAIPVHTEATILAGVHQPKTFLINGFESMGYYLDRFGVSLPYTASGFSRASSGNQCLFNPFKVLIDVECSTNRIARTKAPNDPPTYLQGVQEWHSASCLGLIGSPPCSCADTKCKWPKTGCEKFELATYEFDLNTGVLPVCEGGCTCSGCSIVASDTRAGTWVENPVVVGYWFHPDVLEDISVEGTIPNDPLVCYCMEGYTTTSGVYKYVQPFLSPSTSGTYKRSTCTGKVYLMGSGTYTRKYQCNDNQYLAPHPTTVGIRSQCDCEGDILNTAQAALCGANVRCSDFSSCACNPIPALNVPTPTNYGASPSGGWWVDDCECENMPLTESPCPSKSLITWTITEV